MAFVTYDKCYLWQTHYGKSIMANVTEPLKSPFLALVLNK